MIIEIDYKPPYTIIRVKDDLDNKSDLTEVYSLVKKYLASGQINFAIGFSPRSYFYPPSISVIVKCSELIKIHEGSLSIIEANNEAVDMISSIDTEGFISVYQTENDLLHHASAPIIKE